MPRKKKEKPPQVARAEVLVIEKFNEPKKPDWRYVEGKQCYIGQQADGQYYLKVVNARRWRSTGGYWNNHKEEIYIRATHRALLKVSDNDIDSIIDSLITLKELIKNGQTVASLKERTNGPQT